MSSSLEAKIVVLGAQGVGKTALVERYCKNTFNPAAASTIGASFVTKRVLDSTSDTIVRLQIWDTAGQERFRSMSRLYYRGAQAVLLCYDITDQNSFQEMAGWLRELRKNITPNDDGTDSLIIHVVGTKSDIVADDPSRRRVPFERTIAYQAWAASVLEHLSLEGSGGSTSNASASAAALQSPDSKRSSAFWGQEIGWDCCHEISARDGEGIDEVFRVITRKLVEQRNRRDTELAMSIAGTPMANGVVGPFNPGVVEGTGSFRLGHGSNRRSWMGLTAPGVNIEGPEEERVMLVSAYSDGASMFTAIRKKYHERQSTRELERSLARGRTDIQYQFNQHSRELGRRYEQGDSIAREHMKDIIITLQGALLRHLREAQEQGTTPDLMALQIESDQGRVRTLVILGDLYQRLSRPSPVPPSFSMPIDPNYRMMNSYGRGYPPNGPDRYWSPHTLDMGYPRADILSHQPAIHQARSYQTSASHQRIHWGHRETMGLRVHRLTDRHQALAQLVYNPVSPSTSEPIPEFDVRPATPPIRKPRSSSIPHDVLVGNPWKHESHIDSDDEDAIIYAPINEENHHLSPTIPPPTQPRHDSLSATSTASTDSTPSNPSTRSSTDRPTQAIRPLWPPSKTNNYLGFCKGAWKVYSGFRGFKIYSEPGTGYYTQQLWLRCTKCAFEAPMAPKSSSHNPQFEDSVRTHKASGIRYRFEFLAKSPRAL
ncbi:hypothetical protein N7453_008533 [Penicillium expansum]|nr:hypothetical protein N7453_008533 [Penicillium expansum]